MKRILGLLVAAGLVAAAAPVRASQLGSQIPSNCVEHVAFDSGPDFVDDYRCAGLAIEFHTAGVAFSPGPIWAGQWLFVDEAGQFRVGSCTFNRGIHPTIDARSAIVSQSFPNDPDGAKVAYLTWRYGDTADNLTAAGMWAVLHFYAQDAAGTRRASNGGMPLVPSLDTVGQASGRDDIQAMAMALDAEATRNAGQLAIAVTIDVGGAIKVTLTAGGGTPIADAPITLLLSGQDAPMSLRTGSVGIARAVVPGVTTVVASTPVPGPALVYRGRPAGPDPHGAQNLVTGGAPGVVSTTATVDLPPPTTSTLPPTTSTTTTLVPTSTSTSTTTTLPPTSTSTTTTVPPTTTSTTTVSPTSSSSTSTTSTTSTTLAPAEVEAAPSTAPPETAPPEMSPPPTTALVPTPQAVPPPPGPALPKTGRGPTVVSYVATSLLVAGIGIVGVASRRGPRKVIYTR